MADPKRNSGPKAGLHAESPLVHASKREPVEPRTIKDCGGPGYALDGLVLKDIGVPIAVRRTDSPGAPRLDRRSGPWLRGADIDTDGRR